ncbi:hypothetical protein IGI04_011580 [Brassica rapa subsp. trilocularis]|uniref:Peptidylprolyl isomerase n=1 Tax=Brassica rapa subsp. trilocularis TaxID=1813537 RepID=A0ABQ7N5Q4_BRACM|nr:hypothetical protein IGI04_011580 [Brassica rapa subsp. trilocularis]
MLFIILLQVVCATFVTPTTWEYVSSKAETGLKYRNKRKKDHQDELQIIPTAALAGISVGDPPEEVRLHLIRACEGLREGLSPEFLVRTGSRNSPFRYKVELGDGAIYEGTIGRETLTYRTGYRGFSTIDDVYSGVGDETKKGFK